jgi:superfamily I DNA and/or RNA helicase
MQLKPKDFYSYFRECYKLDYKEFVVDNILSQKYPFKWFVSGTEELLSDALPYIPYNNKKLVELEKEIELYKLEKKLFYACYFVLGRNTNPLIKDKRYCAPLLLFPANIVSVGDVKFLEIELDSPTINRSVLSNLECKDSNLSKDLFIKELTELVVNNTSSLITLKSIIDKYFVNVDAEELLLQPGVWPVTKVRKRLADYEFPEGNYQIVPSFGTVLVDKSESTLKVINDLNEIIEQDQFNASLDDLLKGNDSEYLIKQSLYKSRLNNDQALALENTYRFSNSVIVGPPGTGKSYTITSIVSDLVANNQTVLVVSKTRQAVEVLRSMLQDDFKLKDYLIHTTGYKYKISLKAKIRKYLSGILAKRNIKLNEGRVYRLFNHLQDLEEEFEKLIDRELQISDLEFSADLSFFDKWKKLYYNSGLFNGQRLWEVYDEIDALIANLDSEITTYSRRKIQSNINRSSQVFRKDISLFHDALSANSFTEYKAILNKANHKNILQVFPIWLANLGDLNSVLPLQKDLFDVVIIDEATQCDIATALPAIYRAKRSIVVGDPNQLRHYSFVSRAQQFELQKKFGLPADKIFDYRNRSILDLYISKVLKQEQVSFLREHFRSTPSLIEFSNQKFYEGQLEVIRSTPKHTAHKQIEIINVEGERNSKGINEVEAREVIKTLKKLMRRYRNKSSMPSLGIISPFSSQVNFINKLLKEEFNLDELKKYDLLCGTPYTFQGSEREIVLLSFCVCDQSHPSAFIHANKPEVLNVAITRAKSFQYVFKSVSDKKLKEDSLLSDYFRFVETFSHSEKADSEKDRFQEEVLDEIKKLGCDELKCGYPVAGNLLDILIVNNGRNYFIDLIGYPGMFKEAFSLERYKTLGRTGIKTLPLHYSYWKKNRKEAVKRVAKLINSN